MKTRSSILLATLGLLLLGGTAAQADTIAIVVTSPQEGAAVHTNAQGKYTIAGTIKYTFGKYPTRVKVFTQRAGEAMPSFSDANVTLTDHPTATRVVNFSKPDLLGANGACKCWVQVFYRDLAGNEQELGTSEVVNYTVVLP